jgi:hypothetical protein
MHQDLINSYASIMGNLVNLPGGIAAVQTDLNAAKAQLATSERTLADIEAQTSLNETVKAGKNAEERKALVVQVLRADDVYFRWSHAAEVERMEVAKLSTEYDRLTREFAAMGYAARLTASAMEMLAAMGPAKAGDIEFHMDAAGKSAAQLARVTNGSNGHMTAQDAADAGL